MCKVIKYNKFDLNLSFAGLFTNVVAKWPGSAHDSHVFRTSAIGRHLAETGHGRKDGVLLGDSGYAYTQAMAGRMECFLVTVAMLALHTSRPHILTLRKGERNGTMEHTKLPAVLLNGLLVC